MRTGLRERVRRLLGRGRQAGRRRRRALRRYLERTQTVVHVSVLVLVPLLIGLVTYLSNAVSEFAFLLYPPLASGAYTLFADPEGRYASVPRFVGGLTAGAVCGWVAIAGAGLVYETAPGEVNAFGAALAVFLTGLVTWLLNTEEPAAFSTALLTLFVHARVDRPGLYVLSVAVSSAVVAGGFALWRRSVYEQRDRYLYEAARGDDHILVPMRGRRAETTAVLAARLAAAHRAGKVVLLDLVEEDWLAEAERALIAAHGTARLAGGHGGGHAVQEAGADSEERDQPADGSAVSEAVSRLETRASRVETLADVPCEVVVAVAGQDPGRTALDAAARTNCDLVATPYESADGRLAPFVRTLFRGEQDVLVHRSTAERAAWTRVLVPVRGTSDVAHGMVDFATRLAGETGFVSVATCIDGGSERDRRRAESMLSDLVEPFEGDIETRVAATGIGEFLARNGPGYDLVVMGASRDRSRASRLVSPPTFRRVGDLDVDVAIVDRN
ncbi:MAG: HPP family protein [Haloarculaceae archaeon]